jgi:hypothetical protein
MVAEIGPSDRHSPHKSADDPPSHAPVAGFNRQS